MEQRTKTIEITKEKLYNKDLFFKEAAALINEKPAGFYILSCINIDNFKVINAQHGVAIGDSVIDSVAANLDWCMRRIGGICGHIIGDEFAALYPAENSNSEFLGKSFSAACNPDCIFQHIRIRVGRFVVDGTVKSVFSMYDRAKLAADSIRGSFGKDVEYYKDYMRADLLKKQQIIYEMRDALALGQFKLWLQPQYNHATGAIIGAEVLVRWNKNGTCIPPSEFIPIFEQNGFIYELDKYIFEQTCILLNKWISGGKNPLPLSVNISRADILHSDFIPFITSCMEKYNIKPDHIRLEITESAFADVSGVLSEKIKKLIAYGFIIEIDDFGSGYSSLNTLKDVPAAVLKLDMRFFEKADDNKRAGNIIESVIRMAKWLGMAVIAEGVEEKRLADYLKSVGCYYIQGYYYAKPMPVPDYEQLLERPQKEYSLSRLETLKTLDNNEFWNPYSMDTLIFNSYVGGACIFEYYREQTYILRLNDQYIQEFGGIIPPGTDLHGAAVSKYMDDGDRAVLFETIRRAVDTSKQASCEARLFKGKQTEYVKITIRAIARADDRILCYGVIVNITQQRAAQINERNIVTQLNAMMKSIHASVTATIFNNRNDMEVIYINNGFYKMYGYTKAQYEAEVNHINDLIVYEDYNKAMEVVERVVRTKKPETHDFRCRKRDGSIIWVQIANSVVDLADIGNNILLGVAIDVTENYKLREAERLAEDKLRAILAERDLNA